jgi:transcriptional regulator with XRE-family HTH domain
MAKLHGGGVGIVAINQKQLGTRIQKAIKDAEKATGKTRTEIAAEAGMSLSALDRYAGGRGDPPATKMHGIAIATGKPFGWFAGEQSGSDNPVESLAEVESSVAELVQKTQDRVMSLIEMLAAARASVEQSKWNGKERRHQSTRA